MTVLKRSNVRMCIDLTVVNAVICLSSLFLYSVCTQHFRVGGLSSYRSELYGHPNDTN